ncbi:hypothetical protein KQI58_16890 [Enterococcus raffinosus]|uniref:GapS4a family protein n=1 Tax=Enterococcus raffinosus TaxID=71452 RepID=UPI001C10B731|nr:hypothetical protein [Enterococcus raffinosus]MBU5362746.1 hypothetical protein [Enterococcus raffinosus]
MSGEKSKSSGDYGERIVINFLNLIGWESAEKNITIDCVEEEHESKSSTHGVDGYFRYRSNLFSSSVQEDILFSTKHTVNEYPKSSIKFKEHLYEIAKWMDCFPLDKNYGAKKMNHILERKLSGVLFWLAKDEKDSKSITKEIYNFRNTNQYDFGPIYLVDNEKLFFITKVINYAKYHFDDYNFEYHFTGYNNTDPTGMKSCGKIFPVQLLTTNMLPIRVTKEGKPSLAVFLNENYSAESLKKVLGFAKVLGNDWPQKTYILYPEYNELDNGNDTSSIKGLFETDDFIKNVEVLSFNEGISSLGRK